MSVERELLALILSYAGNKYLTVDEFEMMAQIEETFKEIQELLAQPEQWQPECCICKTNENVEWVGGYQAYRCNSKDCIPL